MNNLYRDNGYEKLKTILDENDDIQDLIEEIGYAFPAQNSGKEFFAWTKDLPNTDKGM